MFWFLHTMTVIRKSYTDSSLSGLSFLRFPSHPKSKIFTENIAIPYILRRPLPINKGSHYLVCGLERGKPHFNLTQKKELTSSSVEYELSFISWLTKLSTNSLMFTAS